MSEHKWTFTRNPVTNSQPENWETCDIDIEKAFKSWRLSLLAHKYVTPEGEPNAELQRVIRQFKNDPPETLPCPILGVGLMDNVEVGSEIETFLVFALCGEKQLTVHIRKNQKQDFQSFITG